MDATLASHSPDKSDTKPEFRKPANDASNRKYRRHSPVSRSTSPSSSGSPKRVRKDIATDDRWKRKDDRKDLDKDSGRNHSRRSDHSYRSERHAHWNSHVDRRYDDYGRSYRHIEEERDYHRSSSRYGRDSKGSSRHDTDRDRYHLDKSKNADDRGPRGRENERGSMAREHRRDVDCSRSRQRLVMDRERDQNRDRNSKEENRTDNKSSSRDDWHDHPSSREAYKEYRKNSDSGFEREEKASRRKMDDMKERFNREDSSEGASKSSKYKGNEQKIDKNQEKAGYSDEEHSSSGKNVRSPNSDKVIRNSLDGQTSRKAAAIGTNEEPSSKLVEDPTEKGILGLPPSASMAEATQDLNAAKVAAMKAAELVNRNLVGVSFLSTDQKKKLLWGSKKNSTGEESGKHWDLFSDRERQEKFNKLMGVKGEVKLDNEGEEKDKVDNLLRVEKQKELELDLEKHYTAGLRRRDGRTVGLGL